MQRDKDLGVDFRSDDEGGKKKSPRDIINTRTHTQCVSLHSNALHLRLLRLFTGSASSWAYTTEYNNNTQRYVVL